MAKAQRKKSVKKNPLSKRKSPLSRVDIFEIEKNPPPIMGRYNPERAAVLAKVDKTLPGVAVGHAFIIPTKYKHTVEKHLRDQYPADKFSFQGIHDNPDAYRVYRLAYPKKA